MPTWGEILQEVQQTIDGVKRGAITPPPNVSPFDLVRRKYLARLESVTGRAVILYASAWLEGADPRATQVDLADVQGFMEVIHGLRGDGVDLILHLPGGSAEAAEALVKYVRRKFSHVRAFVPHAAMSAATMLACSADEIVMGAHSFLGPIDPQMLIRSEGEMKLAPAQAVLDQFARAQKECADPSKLASWIPILKQYGPALLVQCEHHQKLAEELVGTWLATYMLKGTHDAEARGKEIASKLAAHGDFKSHGRVIDRDQARALGILVKDLEEDQALQDAVLSVYHATTHTFQVSVRKIIENHLGKAYVRVAPTPTIQLPPGFQLQPVPAPQIPKVQPAPAPQKKYLGGNKPKDKKKR